MKKNILICCEEMLKEVALKGALIDATSMSVRGKRSDWWSTEFYALCPWCGKELPFPYEEEK